MKSILSLQNITKSYNQLIAVDQLSLEIQHGEIFGFLGPNGAGKTTTIQLICGLLKADSGSILYQINGKSEKISDHYQQIGLCPQEVILWERLTCLEQLMFMGQLYQLPRSIIRDRACQLLDELDLLEKKDRLAKTLSGGMKRRLNIAMALIHDPQIIILDEPEAGLDPQSKVKIRNYIQSLASIKTVILTTHNMDEADRLADRVAIIDHGKLLIIDSPEALKRQLGEGDILDIHIQSNQSDLQTHDFSFLTHFSPNFAYIPETATLSLHLLNGTSQLPRLLETIESQGMRAIDIHIRENTLEDVFIQLTGRSLRE